MKTKIIWLTEKEGGRKTKPNFNKYAAVIKLCEKAQVDSWSILLTEQTLICENTTIAYMQFLSREAPLLKEGVEFNILEGNSVIAKGVVI